MRKQNWILSGLGVGIASLAMIMGRKVYLNKKPQEPKEPTNYLDHITENDVAWG